MSALWIGATGAVTRDSVKLFLIGLPALFAGTWLGLKLFGRINEASFAKSCCCCGWIRAPSGSSSRSAGGFAVRSPNNNS